MQQAQQEDREEEELRARQQWALRSLAEEDSLRIQNGSMQEAEVRTCMRAAEEAQALEEMLQQARLAPTQGLNMKSSSQGATESFLMNSAIHRQRKA